MKPAIELHANIWADTCHVLVPPRLYKTIGKLLVDAGFEVRERIKEDDGWPTFYTKPFEFKLEGEQE